MNELKIGIRAHDLDNAPFTEVADLILEMKKININYIQLVFKKALVDFKVNEDNILKLSQKLKNNNINVAMIGAYFNMIHSNEEKRNNDIAYFKQCMKYAHYFNIDIVGSETGSYNDDKWTYNSSNHTEEAYKCVSKVVEELQEYGKKYNCQIIVEGAYNHVIYKPSLLSRLVNDIHLDNVTFDLFNYLNIDNYNDHLKIFDEAIDLFKDKIKIFHIKDFVVENNKLIQVGIGEGLMNYQYIIPKIISQCPNAYLILEGVTKEKIKTSIAFLRSFDTND